MRHSSAVKTTRQHTSIGRIGDQVSRAAALAMKRGKSVDFTGCWQRQIAD
jgi:hypothetical protein